MTLRIVFRRAAKSEFENAANWYEVQRTGLGEEFVSEIEQALAQAAAAPQRYPVVLGDIQRTVARRFPFSVYFRVRSDTLVVLAVFHGRRNPTIWQRRG
ncbi:MAG: type II toxin-antitoxin system RelE/ParE family toxin [Proteobacteria bacterium]|nr:type II toxin-antitoxin system RelE/ParE family toxin [Pseudomonadota bacterium]